jgi:hypothetical protein
MLRGDTMYELEELKNVVLSVKPEDVEEGRVQHLKVLSVGKTRTKYGEKWVIEGRDERGSKWRLWLRLKDVAFLKRQLIEKNKKADEISIILGTEEYIGIKGDKRKRVKKGEKRIRKNHLHQKN